MTETKTVPSLAVGRPSAVYSELDRWFDEVEAHFDRAFAGWPFAAIPAAPAAERSPGLVRARVDVEETPTAFKVRAEVPGIAKEKIDVRLRGATLEIRGETSDASETEGGSYLRRERRHAGFYRALELPEPVVAADAKAQVHDGLLELELPKVAPTPAEREVQVPVQ